MKLEYNFKTLNIYPENNLEIKLLSSDYLKTKLAYTTVDDNIDGLDISITKCNSCLDLENNKAYINENLSEEQIGYMLRIILDAYIVKNNSLPIHSANVSNKEIGIFILGGSNCGKTTLSTHINEKNPEFEIVGDDHIIISELGIIGNSICRVRGKTQLENCYKKNIQTKDRIERYFIVEVNINDNRNRYEKLDKKEYIKMDLSHVLKYLTEHFITSRENIKIDEFIRKDIKDEYIKLFTNFVNNATDVIKLSGDIEYMTNIIKTLR